MLRQKQHELILKRLESGEILSGKGKNQETCYFTPTMRKIVEGGG